jgi:cyclopropane-fatty-acyl-phospholipid synthase
VLHSFLQRLIRVGALSVRFPDGTVRTYGDGSGPAVRARVSAKAVWSIALNPGLAFGEAYMSGDVALEQGDLGELFEIIGRNQAQPAEAPKGAMDQAVKAVLRQLEQINDRAASRRNVAHHYDLSNDLYRRFLDQDLQYSCAYFARPDMTLEEAQAAKKAHIASKLRLEPGMRVLDIGCGWGGMALELAGRHGVEVLGVTLSQEQIALARERAEAAGLADRIRFELTDFRDVKGPFDRIVSVGMFEHVGAPNFEAFFWQVSRLLTDDGIALLHSISRRTPPATTNAFTKKYIFPGGYIPSISETLAAIERIPLWVTDIEVLRLHYAETLRHWRSRFMADRAAILQMYDERFCRMFEYYLASAELAFRHGGQMVVQMQLAKSLQAVPITRDYMLDAERSGPASRLSRVQAAE